MLSALRTLLSAHIRLSRWPMILLVLRLCRLSVMLIGRCYVASICRIRACLRLFLSCLLVRVSCRKLIIVRLFSCLVCILWVVLSWRVLGPKISGLVLVLVVSALLSVAVIMSFFRLVSIKALRMVVSRLVPRMLLLRFIPKSPVVRIRRLRIRTVMRRFCFRLVIPRWVRFAVFRPSRPRIRVMMRLRLRLFLISRLRIPSLVRLSRRLSVALLLLLF